MDELTGLSAREQNYLWRALESSLAVTQRGQFFLWTQGQVQALIPHDIMVCVCFDQDHRAVYLDCLQGVPLDKAVLEVLGDAQQGFAVRVAQQCREAQAPSAHLSVDDADPLNPLRGFVDELGRLGLSHAMFQSSGPLAGGASSFFALFRVAEQPTPRHTLLLQVLLPHLHLALSRVQVLGLQVQPEAALVDDSDSELTERQLEILHWVKLGKTNYEISQILGISALTVKNHMQKLFKKLNVHNRAQAVARSMSMRMS